VIVTVRDSHGDTVAVDSSAPGLRGINRFVWSLRYDGPTRINFERPEPGQGGNPFRRGGGPRVMPGTYSLTVAAEGHTDSATVTVEPDPIVHGDPAAFRTQLEAALELRNQVSALNEVLNRISSLQSQLQNIQQTLRAVGADSAAGPVGREARGLGRALKQLKDSLYNSDVQRGGQDDVHYLSRFQDRLQGLSFGLGFAYAQPPSDAVVEEWKELKSQLDGYLAQFNGLLQKDVAQFNAVARDHQAPTLVGGDPIQIQQIPLH
jgi:hypothetical protein